MRKTAMLVMALALLSGCASISESERQQLKHEIAEEIRAEEAAGPQAPRDVPVGQVEGRVLHRGQPLAGCRVRLVLMESRRGLFGSSYLPTGVLEAATAEDGTYRFEAVPAGWYKLKWAVPGATHWIRFMSPDPDILVEAGEHVLFRDIESSRRAVGD